ncbi:hypothetical protein E2C01_032156 [Portunus trituberculatus]|uniref:Uncharacterized protein n=1 Tax=Portunus trituberculatus TaxID=210409 RepID=A0A5B7F221_PORTR|nr:hypothetical protein [Portunus trituberculatus]
MRIPSPWSASKGRRRQCLVPGWCVACGDGPVVDGNSESERGSAVGEELRGGESRWREAGGGWEMRVVVAVVVTARSGSALPALVRGKSHSTLLPRRHTPGRRGVFREVKTVARVLVGRAE